MTKFEQSELIAFRQGFLEHGQTEQHNFSLGGVRLRIDFKLAHDFATIDVTSFKRGKEPRVILKDTPVTGRAPCVHLPERSGAHAFNLVVETETPQIASNGLIIRSLLLVRENDDHICRFPDLTAYRSRLPAFARQSPECFLGSR